MKDRLDELKQEYLALGHAIQSGVAYQMGKDPEGAATLPKDLRMGINILFCEQAALAQVLMDKGIMTKEEYFEALILALREEKQRYEELLTRLYGAPVTLR